MYLLSDSSLYLILHFRLQNHFQLLLKGFADVNHVTCMRFDDLSPERNPEELEVAGISLSDSDSESTVIGRLIVTGQKRIIVAAH